MRVGVKVAAAVDRDSSAESRGGEVGKVLKLDLVIDHPSHPILRELPLELHQVAPRARGDTADVDGRCPAPDGTEELELREDVTRDVDGDVVVCDRSLEAAVLVDEELIEALDDIVVAEEEVQRGLLHECVELFVALDKLFSGQLDLL